MKRSLIIGIFLSSISAAIFAANPQPSPISSSLPPASTYTPRCYEVSVETFNLLNEVISVLQHQGRLDESGVEGPYTEVNFDQYNLPVIGQELHGIDEFFPADPVTENNIKVFMKRNQVIVTCREHRLQLGDDYMDNKPLLESLDSVVDKEPTSQNSLLSSIVSSSLFKASCAATIAGVITYYAVGFYNKNKNQEEQYSQKKWAAGTATVTGITAFAYLYWRAQAVLSPDDFEVIA